MDAACVIFSEGTMGHRSADALLLNLDDTERTPLVALLTAEIENTRCPMVPRTKALRAILDKLDPAPPRPEPLPPSKPPAQPSMVLAKKKRRPR
jgi:hypothetical protein